MTPLEASDLNVTMVSVSRRWFDSVASGTSNVTFMYVAVHDNILN